MSDPLRLITEARERAERVKTGGGDDTAIRLCRDVLALASELERHANITEAAKKALTAWRLGNCPPGLTRCFEDLEVALAAAREEQPT